MLTEFPKAKKVHVIDWTSYSSKTTHAIPEWRKTQPNELPPEFPNRLAANTVDKINKQIIKLTGDAIKKEIDAFLANTSFPNPPQYNYRGGPRRRQQSNFQNSRQLSGQRTTYNQNHQFNGNHLNRGQNSYRGQQKRGRFYNNNVRGHNYGQSRNTFQQEISTPLPTTEFSGYSYQGGHGSRSQKQNHRFNPTSISNRTAASTPHLQTTSAPTSSKQVMESFT